MKKNQIHKIGQQQQQQDKSTTNLIFFFGRGRKRRKKNAEIQIYSSQVKLKKSILIIAIFCFICLNIK